MGAGLFWTNRSVDWNLIGINKILRRHCALFCVMGTPRPSFINLWLVKDCGGFNITCGDTF